MLAIVAAVIFVIAFLLEITGTATNVVFAPTSLMLPGPRHSGVMSVLVMVG